MKFCVVCSSFSGNKLTDELWNNFLKSIDDFGIKVTGVILSPVEYKIDGLSTYVFSKKDNETYAFSYLLKNMDMSEIDGMLFADALYFKDEGVLSAMIEELQKGKNIVHVKKTYPKAVDFIAETFLNVKNKINKMILGTKENQFVRSLVAFDRVVLEMLCDFPRKCGFIKETNFLTNTDTGIVNVDSKFKQSKTSITNPMQYGFVGLEIAICITLFMLTIWLPMNIGQLFWAIIGIIVFAVASVVHFSIANIDRLVKLSKMQSIPIVIEEVKETKVEKPKKIEVKKTKAKTDVKSNSKTKSAKTTQKTTKKSTNNKTQKANTNISKSVKESKGE